MSKKNQSTSGEQLIFIFFCLAAVNLVFALIRDIIYMFKSFTL